LEESRLVPEDVLAGIARNIDTAVGHFRKHQRNETEQHLVTAKESIVAAERNLPPRQEYEIALTPHRVEIFPGEEGEVRMEIRNPHAEKVTLDVALQVRDVPEGWIQDSPQKISVPANGTATASFRIKVPRDAKETTGRLSCTVRSPHPPQQSHFVHFRVPEHVLKADLGPLNLLRGGRKENLNLQIAVARQSAGPATIEFQAPDGWTVSPAQLTKELPASGSVSIPLTITAPLGADPASLGAKIQAGWQTLSIAEPYKVIGEDQVALLEGDINQDGVADFVLGNMKMEVACTPILGARILSMTDRMTGHNQLFLDYPSVASAGEGETEKWTEYGGINDIFPRDWPGLIWNNRWEAKTPPTSPDTVSVVMACEAGDFRVEKEIRVEGASSAARLRYTIENLAREPREFFWSNHPDLAPGGKAGPEDSMVVPTPTGRVVQSFRSRLQKTHHPVSAGWTLAHDAATGEYFAQTFNPSLVESIGLWEAENFFTMEVIFNKAILGAEEKKLFYIDYLIGRGKMDEIIATLEQAGQ
jgi:hypothetical protein